MDHVWHAHSGRDNLARPLAEIADHHLRPPRPGERQQVFDHRRGRDPDQAVEQKMLQALLRGQSGELAPRCPSVALAHLSEAQSRG